MELEFYPIKVIANLQAGRPPPPAPGAKCQKEWFRRMECYPHGVMAVEMFLAIVWFWRSVKPEQSLSGKTL